MPARRARRLVLGFVLAAVVVLGVAAPASARPAELDEGSLFTYDRSTGRAALYTVEDDFSLTRTWTGVYGTGYTHVVGMGSRVWIDEVTGQRTENSNARRVFLYNAATGRSATLQERGPGVRPKPGWSRGAPHPPGLETVIEQNDYRLYLDRDTGRWSTDYSGTRSDIDDYYDEGTIAPGYLGVDSQAGAILLFAADGRWAIAENGPRLRPNGVKGRFAVGYERAENVDTDDSWGTHEILLHSTDDARYAVVRADLDGVTVLDHGTLPSTGRTPYRVEGLGPANSARAIGAQTTPLTMRRHGFTTGSELTTGNALFLPQPLTGAAWISHLPPTPCQIIC